MTGIIATALVICVTLGLSLSGVFARRDDLSGHDDALVEMVLGNFFVVRPKCGISMLSSQRMLNIKSYNLRSTVIEVYLQL